MGPDPVLMGLSGKKLLIDKIFAHGIDVYAMPIGPLSSRGHQGVNRFGLRIGKLEIPFPLFSDVLFSAVTVCIVISLLSVGIAQLDDSPDLILPHLGEQRQCHTMCCQVFRIRAVSAITGLHMPSVNGRGTGCACCIPHHCLPYTSQNHRDPVP